MTYIDQNKKTWVGSSIQEICNNKDIWSFNITPINISQYHAVLFKLPVTLKEPPEPFKCSEQKHWDDDHVRMPYSDKNLFPVCENGVEAIKLRWKLIKNTFQNVQINNSYELEAAIHTYNSSMPSFTALHQYFEDMEEEETNHFFEGLLPKIISLALNLPQILPGNIPLLKQHHNRSVSLSQYQVASLLANAFLCTFPWRKSTAVTYPGVNFASLFIADKRPKRQSCIFEKFKCIFNYFRMVTTSPPLGVITFERKHTPKSLMPRWDTLDNNIGHTKIHIDSSGTIEDNGLGFLQVDFANKNIGGGVLRYGCVQEEIRFVICPELIITRLFIEQLTDLEAVVVTGAQRFSNYSGYGDTFVWEGPHNDLTPYDEYGRRRTSISIIDATRYTKSSQQFYPSAMLRELNKAYVGFSTRDKSNLSPVATGNWGCGAFNGSLYLKSLLQLMACSGSGRNLVYYTFGNDQFRDDFYEIYTFLATNNIKIEQLWKILCGFSLSSKSEEQLYPFIQQAYFDSKKQPSVKSFLKTEEAGTSNSLKPKNFYLNNKKINKINDEQLDMMWNPTNTTERLFDEEMIDESDKLEKCCKNETRETLPNRIKEKMPKIDIGDLIDEMDGHTTNKNREFAEDSLLTQIDKLSKNSRICEPSVIECKETMEIVDVSLNNAKSKRKISDYFSKVT
ncbi:poly(ADP-ribose) glycohydrolase-like [Diorhabda carinulata]|uniref:poly(ADP-ribose) glycohydrolase-like n=1 Tax=Diorhabda carinulata TaxID=1163345 RepID=UPI0025A1F8DD|nr:poly(ADP-ribose) glycohydrolase-like [Diorhabda carinulata]